MEKPTIRGEMPMWKAPASVLCGCLAALPLIGCAGDVATPQATAVTPAAIAEPADYYTAAARVYAVGRAVPAPVIDAALAAPQSGGRVSGVVMTSVASGAGGCSESFFYSDPGTGAPPKVEVSRSGDCGMDTPAITGRQPSVLPVSPAPRPNQPRLIEASAGGRNLPPAAKARHLAELIKSAPPG
jgi:hypothetical protein